MLENQIIFMDNWALRFVYLDLHKYQQLFVASEHSTICLCYWYMNSNTCIYKYHQYCYPNIPSTAPISQQSTQVQSTKVQSTTLSTK